MSIYTIITAAILGLALAAPTPDDSSIDAVNPFAAVLFDPYSETGCVGTNQGNTNVNKGTTACVNVSNAKSFNLFADECSSAKLDHYTGFNCGGTLSFTGYADGDECYPKAHANIYSIRITPTC
ncbi:hypothetical protein AMS68_003327 [Peltaster fructicola]|uniref:Uncharacterized protein n=1 Tax=Peltaster fructicola TaxID=286661 RepID=A0A6H0XTM3_9PEZI|nr:hypothetical protein AMS68_003327 [Peltaster fructicola]